MEEMILYHPVIQSDLFIRHFTFERVTLKNPKKAQRIARKLPTTQHGTIWYYFNQSLFRLELLHERCDSQQLLITEKSLVGDSFQLAIVSYTRGQRLRNNVCISPTSKKVFFSQYY